MNARTIFSRAGRWLNVPTGVLIALLQRSPALKVVASVGEYVLASPAGALLKGFFATAASMGAVNSLAGATTLSTTSASPLSATVGTSVSVAFSILGTTSQADSWSISGDLPPGLLFYNSSTGTTGGLSSGTLNSDANGVIYLRGTPTAAGTYTISLRGFNDPNGTGFQTTLFNYQVNVGGGATVTAPSITTHPNSLTVTPGASASFSVTATGTTVAYQWKKNGANIAGATASTLTIGSAGGGDTGDYTVTVSNSAGSVTSRFARLVVGALDQGRIINLSVRSRASGTSPLIVGMVMSGGDKQVLVRGLGPALAAFGVTGTLADPKMDLYDGSTLKLSNDNWGSNGVAAMTAIFSSAGAFTLSDGNSKDAAFLTNLDGPRTIHINPATGSGGVVLVEGYDYGTGNAIRLKNVSARNLVGTGADILIAGFVINGNVPKRVVVRGVGARLATAPFNVPGTLADPKLEIHTRINDVDTIVASNDNWGDNDQTTTLQNAFSSVGAFGLDAGSKDSAIYMTLPAGQYTAEVSGVGNTTGEAIVEVYDAD